MEGKELIAVFLRLYFHIFALIILTLDSYNKNKDLKSQQRKMLAKIFSQKLYACNMPAVRKKGSETVEGIR